MNREELLDMCKEIVTKHRQSSYGTPENNFARIAAYWATYLEMPISSGDVAIMMILLKVARMQHKLDNTDTWIDIAGYAACGCEVTTKK